jgi:hypothetical protein
MQAAIKTIEVACWMDELRGFAHALESDLVLPEDS